MGKLEPQPNGGALYRPDKGETANPAGKPKGTKHISTWIQDMLNDEEFETTMLHATKGVVTYKGAPLKAIIQVAIHKSIHDKEKGQVWAEWLAKHGYGTKIDLTGELTLKTALVEFIDGPSKDTDTS